MHGCENVANQLHRQLIDLQPINAIKVHKVAVEDTQKEIHGPFGVFGVLFSAFNIFVM